MCESQHCRERMSQKLLTKTGNIIKEGEKDYTEQYGNK